MPTKNTHLSKHAISIVTLQELSLWCQIHTCGCSSTRVRARFVCIIEVPGWLLLQKVGSLCTLQESAGSLKGRTAFQLGKLSLFSSTCKEGSVCGFRSDTPPLPLQRLTGYFVHIMSSKAFLGKFPCLLQKSTNC